MFLVNPRNYKKYTIGGKAHGLFKLQELGLNVPDFIVLPYENINVKSLSEASTYTLDKNSKNQLEQILSSWNYTTVGVSVRSSVADEDGTKNAFSGIMKTFLNLRTLDDVLESINLCIASAFSEQAIQYRKAHNLSLNIKAAVIIQIQIDSDISGIVFSTNPKYPQEIAIHSVYGQGEGIVSGELQADEFYFYKHNTQLCRKRIAEKTGKYILTNAGIKLESIPNELSKQECINMQLLNELVVNAQLLERKFNTPQDIEFAIKDNKIWYLQSRAITQKIENLIVFDNSNIQESYSGVVSPLTFSFAQRAYATVYTQTMRALHLPESKIHEHQHTVENLLGLYKGRVYYNINNWYKGLQLLPSFKQNKADMERMMGLKEPVDFVVNTEKSFFSKIKTLPSLFLNIVKLSIAFLKLDTSISNFLNNFSTYHANFYKRINNNQNYTLLELWNEKILLDENLLTNWSVPIINDFYVMMQNGKVHRKLINKGIDNPEFYISKFKFGNEGIASYRQGIALQQLSHIIKKHELLKDKILSNEENIHAYINNNYPEIFNKIEQFINDYGDRTIAELKLETLTMRVEESIFYKYLKIYLQNTDSDFNSQQNTDEKMPSYVFKLLKSIKNREELRLKRTHLFGMYRTLYLLIATKLKAENKINEVRDIFYLNEQEMEAYIKAENLSLSEIVENRKKEWEQYNNEDVPDRLYFPMPVELNISTQEFSGTLQGEPCSGSTIQAEAIVVTNVNDDLNVQGKIIIAKRTDPGWISLFPSAAGVIIEKGSSLSHSVILLREMNKPCIINVPNLTKQINTGDAIEMNPVNGQITIITYGKNTSQE